MLDYDVCLTKNLSKLEVDDLKGCINKLLFEPSAEQTDDELLTVVLLKEKASHLDFLQGYTKWNTVGTWENYPNEKNILMEIQFKDTPDEKVGNRLMTLFEELNRQEIGEKQIYCRTVPIEETTL